MADVHTHRLHAVGVVAQMPQLYLFYSLFFSSLSYSEMRF